MIRSIFAVVAGFVAITILSIGMDALLQRIAPGVFKAGERLYTAPVLLSIIIYVQLFVAVGCYVAAKVAGRRPMVHALALGALGFISSIGGTIAYWNTAPAWYHILSLGLILPAAWLGGYWRQRQVDKTSVQPLG